MYLEVFFSLYVNTGSLKQGSKQLIIYNYMSWIQQDTKVFFLIINNRIQYFLQLTYCSILMILNSVTYEWFWIDWTNTRTTNKQHFTRALRSLQSLSYNAMKIWIKLRAAFLIVTSLAAAGDMSSKDTAHTFIWLNNSPRGWQSSYIVVLYQFHCIQN